jgi:hypothetical protein
MKSVVVMNEFTNTHYSKRGKSIGKYVLEYAARSSATEPLFASIPSENSEFVKTMDSKRDVLSDVDILLDDEASVSAQKKLEDVRYMQSVTFSNDSISLNPSELLNAANEMQRYFDNHHTILKTVISFDEDFLKETGVLSEDFDAINGPYAQIDQGKLRIGVRNALNRFGNEYFDDMKYVAAIQTDTKHVHVHLAIAEASDRKMNRRVIRDGYNNGQERGKLTKHELSFLKRSVVQELTKSEYLVSSKSQVKAIDAHDDLKIDNISLRQMKKNTILQALDVALPGNTLLWTAGSTSVEMRRANRLLEKLVDEVEENDLFDHFSMKETSTKIEKSAKEREETGELSAQQTTRWAERNIALMRQQVAQSFLDAIKRKRKEIEEDEPAPASITVQLAGQNTLSSNLPERISSGLARTKEFSARYEENKSKALEYLERMGRFDELESQGNVSDDAKAMRDFYESEAEFHGRLADRYAPYVLAPLNERLNDSRVLNQASDYLKERKEYLQTSGDAGAKHAYNELVMQETRRAWSDRFASYDDLVSVRSMHTASREDALLEPVTINDVSLSDSQDYYAALDEHLHIKNIDGNLTPNQRSVAQRIENRREVAARLAVEYLETTQQSIPESLLKNRQQETAEPVQQLFQQQYAQMPSAQTLQREIWNERETSAIRADIEDSFEF